MAKKSSQLGKPLHSLESPSLEFYLGDCREQLAAIAPTYASKVDLIFADPPFNWNRPYDKWDDKMPREDYLAFTYAWIDRCLDLLSSRGTFWINIPDDTCAEIVMHMKSRNMHMVNWCIWHYRFGQNAKSKFISSKVHALYFARDPANRTWNPEKILEPSDRATTYFDARTTEKADGFPPGMRMPMDVWYGPGLGRIQGNNKERRGYHDNQLPEAYLERVVLSCSNEGDLVLDPFIGSGTTAVMARHYGRRFIGTEFSQANADSAFERVKAGSISAGRYLGVSTAIFKPRATTQATAEKFEVMVKIQKDKTQKDKARQTSAPKA